MSVLLLVHPTANHALYGVGLGAWMSCGPSVRWFNSSKKQFKELSNIKW